MKQYLQQRKGLVQGVFNKVFDKYDTMNDFMSLGAHRIWKKNLILSLNPSNNKNLIDVACGTGDIAKLYIESTNEEADVMCVDPNINMINSSKKRLNNFKNIKWSLSNAENLKIKSNSYDFYTISFGLRNTKNIKKSLEEAYRVLKPGGKFVCLEFSKIENKNFNLIYKKYSKIIPSIGKFVVGDDKPYEYLVKSIENFINQEELVELMKKSNFQKCKYRNLSGGIVAIHSGWKI
jgi:demethylmenaquinone methyltransferase/2-methoxy-6-polyprenyl-1,4-benzoquinol methylase